MKPNIPFEHEIEAMEIGQLIHRKLSDDGTALSPADEDRLGQWLQRYDPDHTIIHYFSGQAHDERDILETLARYRTGDSLRRVLGKIRAGRTQRIRRIQRLVGYGIAASLLIGLGLFAWLATDRQHGHTAATELVDISPGGNRAILVLPDGQQLDLREDNQALVLTGSSFTYEDGTPVLSSMEATGTLDRNQEDIYASLITPKGGQYQLVLPDGSKVWLNAASSLRYPVSFDSRERVVELEGEAYFEVRQTVGSGGQPLPFRVKTPGQLIDVLGTSFNVSAYEEDGETLTTLLEGSVRVQDAVTGGQFELVPGEQARLTNESFVKRQADIQQVTAWKEGFFQFKKADIYTVMREIARWYNVEVRFEGVPPTVRISGKAYRNVNASQALEILQHLDIPFRIGENEIIITNRESKK